SRFVIDRSSVQVRSSAPFFPVAPLQTAKDSRVGLPPSAPDTRGSARKTALPRNYPQLMVAPLQTAQHSRFRLSLLLLISAARRARRPCRETILITQVPPLQRAKDSRFRFPPSAPDTRSSARKSALPRNILITQGRSAPNRRRFSLRLVRGGLPIT